MCLTKAALEAALGKPAYIAEEEIEPLCRHAAQVPADGTVVEIGAAWGASAALLLLSAPEPVKVWSVDPFVPHEGWQASRAGCREAVKRVLRRVGGKDWLSLYIRWALCQMYSHEVAAIFDVQFAVGQDVSLLYIDGDHSYEAVGQDFDLWLPHMRKGGVILLHDSRRLPGTPEGEFARGWPGPTQVAEELRDWQTNGEGCPVELIEEAYSLTIWRVR